MFNNQELGLGKQSVAYTYNGFCWRLQDDVLEEYLMFRKYFYHVFLCEMRKF